MSKKLTTEEFIEKAKKVHEDRYDYSNVKYVNNRTVVNLICKEHGSFKQRPMNHLNGNNCKKCVIKLQTLTTDDFITRSKILHFNKFDYSLVKYVKCNKKIKIICPIHGEFEQISSEHLRGRGCYSCAKDNEKLSIKDFEKKANEVHSFRYDYSLVDYKGNKIKIDIICLSHGIFKQIPNAHLNGQGCLKCNCLSTEEIILKAKKIHGDRYDYSKVNYKNINEKIEIICLKHGVFEQDYYVHLRGCGCPICSLSRGELKIKTFFDKNKISYICQYKFENCKNINTLSFDFYLIGNNICIEYDGEQHFKSINFFGGEEKLISTKENDQIKTDYCLNNNIKLIRIPYWDFKNIEQILEKELNIVCLKN